MGHKKLETGIFTPIRYGLTRSVEIAAFALYEPLYPNIRCKIHWYTIPNWNILIATRHHIHYPTPLLKYIARNEPFGIDALRPYPTTFYYITDITETPTFILTNSVSPKPIVPRIFTFTNEVLFSKLLIPGTTCTPPNLLLTLKLGIVKGLISGKSNLPIINEKLVYHRTCVYRDTILWNVGLDLEGHINSAWDFSVDLDFFSVDWDVDHWALENKGGLLYYFSPKMFVYMGYKLSYGTYPYDNKFFISPVIDLVYRFKIKKKEDGLMKKDMYERKLKREDR